MKKKTTKTIALLFAVLLLISILSACGAAPAGTSSSGVASAPEEDSASVCMVMITNTSGLGDGGFNDMAWAGMEMAKEELGCEISVIENSEAAQYIPTISQAAEQGFDVIVLVGFLLVDALAETAPNYPDTTFVMIDGDVPGDNIYSLKFNMQESSYLAGALAALELEANQFGYVGGMEIPDTLAWESGYVAGIKTVNPGAEVAVSYVGTFEDPGKAKELALAQFSAGASVVMECSSGGAIGVAEAARDSGQLFIATDKSKDEFAPGFEFTAALARRDMAVLNAARMIVQGTGSPGLTVLTSADGVFGLPDDTANRYGEEAARIIDDLQQRIIAGEIVVPKDRDEVENFQYPEINQ